MISSIRVILIGSVLLLLSACTNVAISTQQDIGVPTYPPTNAATVQILRSFPQRPFVRIGEVTAEPTGNPTVPLIEEKMRDGAAQIGANAAVIVSDRTVLMGASITGGFANRQLSRDYQRVISAVAIRYVG